MMLLLNGLIKTVLSTAVLTASLGSVGCASTQTSHIIEPEPPASINAVAIADDTYVAQSYSLVAADSIGLATFGQQIVLDDLNAIHDSFAEAN